MAELRSWALGTTGLWLVLCVAVAAAIVRPFPPLGPVAAGHMRVWGGAALGVQVAHASQELLMGFPDRFPTLLGLAPWRPGVFALFNAGWSAVWVVRLVAATRGRRLAEWPMWFLGLALLLNGVLHPLLALVQRGYFPGRPAPGSTTSPASP